MLLEPGSYAFGIRENENSRDPWLGPGCWEVIPNGSECGE